MRIVFIRSRERSDNPTTYNASGDLSFLDIRLTNQESIQIEIGGLLPEHEDINYVGETEDGNKRLRIRRGSFF